MWQKKNNCTLFDYLFINDKEMDWIFDEFFKLSSYPRYGEVRRYKVVPMTERDIAEEEIKVLEEKITAKNKQVAELQEELEKQKKRLKP
jgi:hypothetical protein